MIESGLRLGEDCKTSILINPISLCFTYLEDHTKIASSSEFDGVLIA